MPTAAIHGETDPSRQIERLRNIEAAAREVVEAYTSEQGGDLPVAEAVWRLKALLDSI